MISRKLDELGRIVLPQEMRAKAGIQNGDELNITQDESGAIHISPSNRRCKLCGGAENLHLFEMGQVCAECVRKISQ